jgi:hypothetical protein
MRLEGKGIVVVITAVLLIAIAAVHATAGQEMAYSELLKTTIRSGSGTWYSCGSVTIDAPSAGSVIVTASGMAWFSSLYPTLTLTLATTGAVKGPWIFTLSPGLQPYQTYTVRMVFSVVAGENTFYLNAQSNNGNGSSIGVQTGSLTAEWYAASDVQAAPAGAEQSAPENANPRRN